MKELKESPETEEKEKAKALELLKNPNLTGEFLKTCHTRYLDRDRELVLIKLVTISRKFDHGISVVITGTSSVGKSQLIGTILSTVWDGDKEDFTRVSTRYFEYQEGSLDHKVVTFFEMRGTEDAAYGLKIALSEGVFRLGTVAKDSENKFKAYKIEKSAKGLVVLSTTTSSSVEHEFNTRVVVVEITHDQELARDVLRHKVKGAVENEVFPFRIWQVADYLIEPCEVIIPYAEQLAEMFPTSEERYMRDFDKVLTLIKASALLHQYQRERDKEGRIIATDYDYYLVYGISDLIIESTYSNPKHIINFLNKAKELTNDRIPTREEIMNAIPCSLASIKRYVDYAFKGKFIEVEGIGKEQKIKVLEIPKEFVSPLPKPSELKNSSMAQGGSEGREPEETQQDQGIKENGSLDQEEECIYVYQKQT